MAAETIFALATAPGRGAIAVVRISGPLAGEALRELAGLDDLPRPRSATLVKLTHGGSILDQSLCIWFPAPASATGEDVVELHLHGGPAVIRTVLSALATLDGLRLAEPGEFSRRAFLNDKMDLIQAEGLADLIDAETEQQAAQALDQMGGSLSRTYESWRARIVQGLAYAEAVLDFPDEDVPDSAALRLIPELKLLLAEIERHLADGHRGEIVRDGLAVAILGRPNAGKSSLLNALARREVAIVSDIPGTTRDVLEVRLNLGGYAVVLADTAGLRDTTEQIESEGIRRALARADASAVRLLVLDPSSVDHFDELLRHARSEDLILWSKADLGWHPPILEKMSSLSISTKTGEGLDQVMNWLTVRAGALAGPSGGAVLTRLRHREALSKAAKALSACISVMSHDLDLAAEDLRIASRSIGQVTGRVDVDDVLDVVFRDFCIGK